MFPIDSIQVATLGKMLLLKEGARFWVCPQAARRAPSKGAGMSAEAAMQQWKQILKKAFSKISSSVEEEIEKRLADVFEGDCHAFH